MIIRKIAMPAADYGTSGLSAWIQDNVITIILLVIACSILWAGKAGNISKVVTIFACLLVGVVALGFVVVDGAAEDVGKFVVDLIKS